MTPQKTSLIFWIVIALGLVVIFNSFPDILPIPTWFFVATTLVILVWHVVRAKRHGTLHRSLNAKVIGNLSAKQLMSVGAGLLVAGPLWIVIAGQWLFTGNKSATEIDVFFVMPAVLLIVAGGICFGCGFYKIVVTQ